MILAVAVGPGDAGDPPDLKWWRGYSVLSIDELRHRLDAREPCAAFDWHSGIDEDPAAARERLYDFIHEAEERGQSLVFYELNPDEYDRELATAPDGGWDAQRVPVAHVLNSLRSSEITEYQCRHHDDRDGGNYDPLRHADQLAEARARRWRGEPETVSHPAESVAQSNEGGSTSMSCPACNLPLPVADVDAATAHDPVQCAACHRRRPTCPRCRAGYPRGATHCNACGWRAERSLP